MNEIALGKKAFPQNKDFANAEMAVHTEATISAK